MRANAKIFPNRLPALSPVRLGRHRHGAAVKSRRRASLVLRPLSFADGVGFLADSITLLELRRPADARHAA